MGLGEDVVIEMSVASGEAMGGREGLLMGEDCLGGNEGGASSTSVTSLFGDTDLTMWEKVYKGINLGLYWNRSYFLKALLHIFFYLLLYWHSRTMNLNSK